MNIDTRFPTKLDTIDDAPEPLRKVLGENITSKESVRLLVYAPTFSTMKERSPATVLVVSDNGWLVVSESEDGAVNVQKSKFRKKHFLANTQEIFTSSTESSRISRLRGWKISN